MNNIYLKAFTLLLASVFMGACEKNAVDEHTAPVTSGALIKFFTHAEGAPRVNFFLNDVRITGSNPTATNIPLGLAYGTSYPSNGYVNVPAGDLTVAALDTVTSETKGKADLIASTATKLDEKDNYSAYLVGTTGNYETFVVKDILPEDNFTRIYFRFGNTMAGIPFNVDVVAFRLAVAATATTPAVPELRVPLGTNIGFKQFSDYTELPAGGYRFIFYRTGTTTVYANYPSATGTLVLNSLGRVYSIFLRGTYAATPKTTNLDYWRER